MAMAATGMVLPCSDNGNCNGFKSEDSKEQSTGFVEMAMIMVTRVTETMIATPTMMPSSASLMALVSNSGTKKQASG